MSTKIRVQITINGCPYAGWRAKQVLHQIATSKGIVPPESDPQWKKLLFIYNKLPSTSTKSIIVTREPRKLAASRSRYIEVCRKFKLGKKITKAISKKSMTFSVNPFNSALNALRVAQRREREEIAPPARPTLRRQLNDANTTQRPASSGQGIGGRAFQWSNPIAYSDPGNPEVFPNFIIRDEDDSL
jgi:hypothetical protein